MLDPILALCARAESHPDQLKRLNSLDEGGIDWTELPERAEKQGLPPLVHTHFNAANLVIPDETKKILAALSLRHHTANNIRYTVLAEILGAFNDEGLGVLVLKGAALASTVYPEPRLRPMRDIDLLVKEADARRAQAILVDMGFNTWIPGPAQELTGHHLPIAQKAVNGLTVSIEVHQRLLPYVRNPIRYEDLSHNAFAFSVKGIAAQTLGHEDMLWHIYRHSFAYPLIVEPIRLIWVADFVSAVEKYVNEIDWAKITVCFPALMNILPLFHYLTPWSNEVLEKLALDVNHSPDAIGHLFEGWPKSSLADQRKKGILRFLSDTFRPPEWWTLLYYGIKRRSMAWWWTRLFRHPLHISQWVLQYLSKSNSLWI